MIPIFDGHNDTLLKHLQNNERDFFTQQPDGHIDYPRGKAGGFAGGFFAVFPPPEQFSTPTPELDHYPAPSPIDPAWATFTTNAMIKQLYDIERASNGRFTVVRNTTELATAIDTGVMAAILHFEGAEAIDPELAALDMYYAAGLRSLGIVWSRANRFGYGVPFAFPASPDLAPGLTGLGRALVKRCNELGIMIDLSHISEKGFWDVAALSDAPLVATHSNVHAICPTPRNLTAKQLAAIKESNGMVGLNFATGFLAENGSHDADLPLEVMVRHIDALVEAVGIDRVGLGSDFDGATMPAEIGDISGVQKLVEKLREAGYDQESLEKIGYKNWLRVLKLTWKE